MHCHKHWCRLRWGKKGLQTTNTGALKGDQRAADIEAKEGFPFDDGVVPEPAHPHHVSYLYIFFLPNEACR